MKRLPNEARAIRLIKSAVSDLSLDLRDIVVLTEAASGAYAVTPIIAALGGAAKVYAVTRSSGFGTKEAIGEYTYALADQAGVRDKIEISYDSPDKLASKCHLVTNLGFVRPIDEQLIKLLSRNAAVSLMWETWEYRETDVDLKACEKYNIPILGTCETHNRLRIFRYVGLIALKILLQRQIEVFNSKIVIIGSGHFGHETKHVLESVGATCLLLDPEKEWQPKSNTIESFVNIADAVVVVEHRNEMCLLGGETGIPLDWVRRANAELVHICGKVDDEGIQQSGIIKIPEKSIDWGYMSYATDFVGPKPVIDLHTAGLKVGEELVRGMRKFEDRGKAMMAALKNSLAMGW